MFLDLCKEILFPIYCVGCDKEGKWLCKKCQSKLKPNYQNNKAVSCLDGLMAFFSYNDLVISLLLEYLHTKLNQHLSMFLLLAM